MRKTYSSSLIIVQKLQLNALVAPQVQLLQATIEGYGSSDKARKLLVYLPGIFSHQRPGHSSQEGGRLLEVTIACLTCSARCERTMHAGTDGTGNAISPQLGGLLGAGFDVR